MRGLITVALALALPGDFPHRDLVVLTAFCHSRATIRAPSTQARRTATVVPNTAAATKA
jgi:NhaP-type Na+/H+ or K+/H+ antiporter